MKKYVIFAVLALISLSIPAYADTLSISPESGFYDTDIDIVIAGENIMYSLDGTTDGQAYTEPISIKSLGENKSYTVIAWNDSGDMAYATYIVGTGAKEIYDIPVAVITTKDESLHDYETGILEKGKTWDDYDIENPDNGLKEGKHPANYNQRGDEWIRNAHVAIFDERGEEILSQLVGLSVSGTGSSKYAQKSLKVKADSMYDSLHDEFELENFFDFSGNARKYPNISEFNNMVFRSGGNDYVRTQIRWNLCAELAKLSGFDIIAFPTPVILYLNNEYYGLTQLQPTWSRKFIGDCVGIADQENIETITAGDKSAYSQAGLTDIVTADLSVNENLDALCEKIDIYQFLDYCAFEMICGNTDWPSGNVKMWRYTGEYDENIPCTDGKWRYIVYDLDFAFDLYGSGDEIFDMLMTNPDQVRSLFKRITDIDKYGDYFVRSASNMLDIAFTKDIIASTIEENDALVRKYIGTEKREGYVYVLIDNALSREKTVREKLSEYFPDYEYSEEQVPAISGLVISAVSSKGDMVSIVNLSDASVSLSGYCLTDNLEKPAKTPLDGIILEPSGEHTLYEDDLEFGIKSGETVYLTDDSGIIVDSVFVPRMTERDVYKRVNGAFLFFDKGD